MRVGITGHQRLNAPASWRWVERKLDETLETLGTSLTGISSLAIGADQLFAKLVLARGGELQAVLPFASYEETFKTGQSLRNYQRLLNRATKIEVLPPLATKEDAYFAAGQRVIELSEIVIAIWNGKQAAGWGGTGDAVRYAQQRGGKVIHINPYSREVRTWPARM
jgi:hypothetical protein